MDKANTSFFKLVYKILLFILLIPVRIVKFFCLGFFYCFYVFMELVINTVILLSFILYKSLKYCLLSLTLPVMIVNVIKRKKKDKHSKEDEIVRIPDNALELQSNYQINNSEVEDNSNVTIQDLPELEEPEQISEETDEAIEPVQENQEDVVDPITEDNEDNSELVENTESLDIPEVQDDIAPIEDNEPIAISEPINSSDKVIKINDIPKKKRHISWRKLLLPIQIISYPVYKLVKYFVFGLAVLLNYFVKGFTVVSFYVYKLFKYLLFSLGIFFMIYNIFARKNEKARTIKAKIKLEKVQKKKEEQFKAKLLTQQKQEDKLREELKKKKEKEENEYLSKKTSAEKKTFKEKVDAFLNSVFSFPKDIFNKIKYGLQNSVFVRDYKNKKDMSRQVLLINFEGEDAEKSDIKVVYQYTAKDPNGKIVTDYFEAYSKVEVHSFLLSEGYEVYNIKTNKWIQFAHKSASVSSTKMKNKDLIFFLTQLSTYIKAGIPLVEALKILARQYSKNKSYQKLFRTIIYDLSMGENFSTALEKQKDAFPRILINMVKASELTGELPEVLDDMAEYFTEMEQTKKQMITALMYPMIILVFAIAVIIFILVGVIPQFVEIYSSMDSAQIPGFTLFILSVSDYLKNNYLILIIIVTVVVVTLVYLYKNVKVFRTLAQWLFMHMPVIGNVIIYNEVTIFTKTFSSLLSHNVFITDSMNILNKVTNNEIYKMIILDTITNLAKGEKISKSFENHWAFPIPAYEMLVTGEKTGQLPEMMKKVSEYYQDLHKNSVTRIKTFIEPILIIFLTVIVGAIVLAIVIPMFNLYQSVQNYS